MGNRTVHPAKNMLGTCNHGTFRRAVGWNENESSAVSTGHARLQRNEKGLQKVTFTFIFSSIWYRHIIRFNTVIPCKWGDLTGIAQICFQSIPAVTKPYSLRPFYNDNMLWRASNSADHYARQYTHRATQVSFSYHFLQSRSVKSDVLRHYTSSTSEFGV